MSTDVNMSQETESDPLKTIADALQEAVNGSSHAQASSAPAQGEFWTRMIYNTSYAVSYGVVMPTALVASLLPQDNALMYGLVDGARAATDAALGNRQAAEPQKAESQSPAAHGASQNGQSQTP